MVVRLDDRLDGLAARGCPAAEDDAHLLAGDEPLSLAREGRPVGAPVDDDRFDAPSEHAAARVDLFDGHLRRAGDRSLADRHRASQRVEHTGADRPRGPGARRSRVPDSGRDNYDQDDGEYGYSTHT